MKAAQARPKNSEDSFAENAPGAVVSPVPARPLTEEQMEALAIQQLFIPSCLAAIVRETEVSRRGANIYLGAFVGKAGDPSDPVERILLEQLSLAHHRIAKLHVQADAATTLEAQKILNTAATHLLAEVRQVAMAIQKYRQPVSPKQFNVVHQQNIAGTRQEVTYLDHSTPAGAEVSFASRTKLEGDAAAPGDVPKEEQNGTDQTRSGRKVPRQSRRRKDQRQAAAVEG